MCTLVTDADVLTGRCDNETIGVMCKMAQRQARLSSGKFYIFQLLLFDAS